MKVSIGFKEGGMPAFDAADPRFEIDLAGGVKISGRLNPKAARKAAGWRGSGVLQGKLTVERGQLVLADAGLTLNEPKPPDTASQPAS
jgi:hypothetical protein